MRREPGRVLPLTILSLIIAATPGIAGAQEYKGEVCGNLGYGAVSDDDYALGQGVVVGAGMGYRFSRRWGATFDFSRNTHHRDFSSYGMDKNWDGHSLIFNGSLMCHFRPESRTQPYVRFGLSYAHQEHNEHHRETVNLLGPRGNSEVREETTRKTNNYMGLDLGAGVKIFVTERVFIKPEFRYAALSLRGGNGHPDVLWAPWFCVGIGYRW